MKRVNMRGEKFSEWGITHRISLVAAFLAPLWIVLLGL